MKRLTNYIMPLAVAGALALSCGGENKQGKKAPEPQKTAPQVVVPQTPQKPKISPIDSILTRGFYTVQEGDDLNSIAKKLYGTSQMAYAIAKWNNFDLKTTGYKEYFYKITPGQKIKVEDVELKYVENGDTFLGLSRDLGISVEEFHKKFNWIGGELVPGEVYFVPKNSSEKTENSQDSRGSKRYGFIW